MSRRDLTEPEALVWAAAFAKALSEPGLPTTEAAQHNAMYSAWHAVQVLRSIRIQGREDEPRIRMLRDFRMDEGES